MTQERMLEAVFKKQSDAVQQILRRTCIVDFGVITEVLGENVVKVGVAVADSVEDVQIIVCTLISPCSATMALNIEPSVGDKVLILFPRHFSSSMFEVTEGDPAPIIDSACQSYSRLGGLAILMNQFNYDKHRKNFQLSADGVLSIRLPYDDNDSANVITAQTDGEGKMSLDISKNDGDASLVAVDIDQDGNANLNINNGKATVKIDSSGNVEVNSQGKYTIKNGSTDLKDVIDGLAKELENLTTVGSPATQATSPASKGTIATWRSGKLSQLFT